MLEMQTQTCDLHGTEMTPGKMYTIGHRTFTERPSCPTCEAARREQTIQEAARAEAALFRKRQLGAKIPSRYLSANLQGIIAETAAQQDIREVADRFVSSRGTDPSSLMLIGKLGAGKTYLGIALANEFLKAGRTAYYSTALGLVREMKATWNPRAETTEAQLFKKLVEKDLLVLDELAVQLGSAGEQAMIADLLDSRYGDGRPTIVIGNLTMSELTSALGEPTIDRFKQGGKVLVFAWESRRPMMHHEGAKGAFHE